MVSMIPPMVILAVFECIAKSSKPRVGEPPTVKPTNGLVKGTELVQNTTIANDSE